MDSILSFTQLLKLKCCCNLQLTLAREPYKLVKSVALCSPKKLPNKNHKSYVSTAIFRDNPG